MRRSHNSIFPISFQKTNITQHIIWHGGLDESSEKVTSKNDKQKMTSKLDLKTVVDWCEEVGGVSCSKR